MEQQFVFERNVAQSLGRRVLSFGRLWLCTFSLVQPTGGYQRFADVHLLAFCLTPIICQVRIVQIHLYDQRFLRQGQQFRICQ